MTFIGMTEKNHSKPLHKHMQCLQLLKCDLAVLNVFPAQTTGSTLLGWGCCLWETSSDSWKQTVVHRRNLITPKNVGFCSWSISLAEKQHGLVNLTTSFLNWFKPQACMQKMKQATFKTTIKVSLEYKNFLQSLTLTWKHWPGTIWLSEKAFRFRHLSEYQ